MQSMMNTTCRVSVFIFICFILMHGLILFVKGGKSDAITALNIIGNTHTDICSASKLYLTLDFTLWNGYANLAIYNANYMSTIIYQNKGILESIPDLTFFNLARNVVMTGSPQVFSSGLAFEPDVFSRYKAFAPYAYYKHGVIRLYDLSLSYVYQTSVDSEWYYNLESRKWDNASSILTERHQRLVNNFYTDVNFNQTIVLNIFLGFGLFVNFFLNFDILVLLCNNLLLSQTIALICKRIKNQKKIGFCIIIS